MFFDTKVFISFVKDCVAHGITVPIIPGIMCISNYNGFKKMLSFCQTRVTQEVMAQMDALKDDKDAIKAYGVEFGVKMCKDLLDSGVHGLHFYTLNSEKVVDGIMASEVIAAAFQ